MPEYTNHQKKIIERYYDNLDTIQLARLQELVGELYLVDTDKKRDRLWTRVQQAMQKLKVKPGLIDHIMTRRDPKILALNLEDWLKASGANAKRG